MLEHRALDSLRCDKRRRRRNDFVDAAEVMKVALSIPRALLINPTDWTWNRDKKSTIPRSDVTCCVV